MDTKTQCVFMSELEQPRHRGKHPRCVLHVWAVEGGGKGGGTPQKRKTRPCGRVFRVWVVVGSGKGGGTPQTRRTRRWGSRVHVWGVENYPDPKNATMWSRSSGLGGRWWREGQRNTQTRRTRPCGRVLRVLVVVGNEKGAGTPQTRRTRRCGRVFMSGVWETTQTRKTRPQGRVLRVWVVVGVGRVVGHPRHEERDAAVACSCLGYGKRPRHKKRDHRVAFLGSGW